MRDSDVAKMYAHLHDPAAAGPPRCARGTRRGSTRWWRARWPRTPTTRFPSAGDFGRAAARPPRPARSRPAPSAAWRSARRRRRHPPVTAATAASPSSPRRSTPVFARLAAVLRWSTAAAVAVLVSGGTRLLAGGMAAAMGRGPDDGLARRGGTHCRAPSPTDHRHPGADRRARPRSHLHGPGLRGPAAGRAGLGGPGAVRADAGRALPHQRAWPRRPVRDHRLHAARTRHLRRATTERREVGQTAFGSATPLRVPGRHAVGVPAVAVRRLHHQRSRGRSSGFGVLAGGPDFRAVQAARASHESVADGECPAPDSFGTFMIRHQRPSRQPVR